MEGKRGSECLLKSLSNIDFNPNPNAIQTLANTMTIMAPVGSTNKLAFVMPIAFKAKLARLTDGLKRNSQRMEAAAALVHSSLGYQTPLQVEIATLTSQMAAWFNAFQGSNKLLIAINDLFELWKVNVVLNVS